MGFVRCFRFQGLGRCTAGTRNMYGLYTEVPYDDKGQRCACGSHHKAPAKRAANDIPVKMDLVSAFLATVRSGSLQEDMATASILSRVVASHSCVPV